jgi:pSer/pThr/pTyr-binding forkhead associated (FHA) protein
VTVAHAIAAVPSVPAIVLTVLKLLFLALLYLFVYRVTRSVVVDLRSQRADPAAVQSPTGAASPPAVAAVRRKGKSPGSVVVLDDKGRKAKTIRLAGAIQIGRADACHIKLPDTYVSQFHARIFPEDGSWFVEDLGSTNGTFLNQRKVAAPSEVRAGDRVRIGTTTLELRS